MCVALSGGFIGVFFLSFSELFMCLCSIIEHTSFAELERLILFFTAAFHSKKMLLIWDVAK